MKKILEYNTLTEVLLDKAHSQKGLTHVAGEGNQTYISYPDQLKRGLGLLHHLQKRGMQPGSFLILVPDSPVQFVDAFWAGILGGIVPVPLSYGISDEHRWKLLRIFELLDNAYVIISSDNLQRLRVFSEKNESVDRYQSLAARALLIDEIDDLSVAGKAHASRPDDLAFMQFSSGSTSTPKGVMLTHQNLLNNIYGITHTSGWVEEDVSISWMPLTHDMGLIGFHLSPLCLDNHHFLIPTDVFIRRPLLWMQLIHDNRGTVSSSPNFGFAHFLRAYTPEKAGGWDLSGLKIVFNGAEPIDMNLCRTFLETMKIHKFPPEAMYTVYGLAEASLAVSIPKPQRAPASVRINRARLGLGERVELASQDIENAVEFAIVGYPVAQCDFKVLDEEGNELPEHRIGLIHISGKNVTRGYYKLPEVNREVFTCPGWLNTGDLGFIHEGQLVVTGRQKEIIFVNGQNYYPHDLEEIIQRHTRIETGKIAFAPIKAGSHSQTEWVAAFVVHKGAALSFVDVCHEVRRIINEQVGIDVQVIVPIRQMPKTTSGKIQRLKLANEYMEGLYDAVLDELNALLQAQSQAATNTSTNAVEWELLSICNELIADKQISTRDNLFEIGTNSLTLAQIHERIDERYPGQLDINDFFDHPTIASLAGYLNGKLAQA